MDMLHEKVALIKLCLETVQVKKTAQLLNAHYRSDACIPLNKVMYLVNLAAPISAWLYI